MKKILLFALTLFFLIACHGIFPRQQGVNLFPACPSIGRSFFCGYIDKTGKMIISPNFQKANEFSEGLASVQSGEMWGYINEKGEMVINPQFSKVEKFSDGIASASPYRPNAVYIPSGIIDSKGMKVLDPKYLYIGRFSEGLAPAVTTPYNSKEKFGYIDKQGNVVIDGKYDFASSFSEGLALTCSIQEKSMVSSLGTCNYIDKQGNVTININAHSSKYTILGHSDFSEGLAAVCVADASKPDDPNLAKCGYIDKSGKFVLETKPAIGGHFSEGLAPIIFADSGSQPLWGYIDRKGTVVIKSQFAEAYPFSQGIARVRAYDESGSIYHHDAYVDKQGNVIWDAIKNKIDPSTLPPAED